MHTPDEPRRAGLDDHDDALGQAVRWRRAGRDVALATVVATWGSSPRPAGSQLAIRDDGLFLGSVSGGCVEGRVIEVATEMLRAAAGGQPAPPRVLEFGVANEEAWDVGLACGGTVRIFVERVTDALLRELDALLRAREEKRALVVVTELATGARRLLDPGSPDGARDDELGELDRAARSDRAALLPGDGDDPGRFLHPHSPPLRLLIVGAVHVSAPLITIARLAGYEVTLIDPRPAFASPRRFPGVRCESAWPDELLPTLAPDVRTAIVTLTHDPKIDDPALIEALRSPAFYIGALGSRKTHAARRVRLAEEGFDDAALARIHGPIGLPLGGRAPAEIAISIMAELTQVLRSAPA
ncbi:MAG: XdhC family protein [Myxococcales bacterium]|nr:XdhC family protein [Myxococcales bacterium]